MKVHIHSTPFIARAQRLSDPNHRALFPYPGTGILDALEPPQLLEKPAHVDQSHHLYRLVVIAYLQVTADDLVVVLHRAVNTLALGGTRPGSWP